MKRLFLSAATRHKLLALTSLIATAAFSHLALSGCEASCEEKLSCPQPEDDGAGGGGEGGAAGQGGQGGEGAQGPTQVTRIAAGGNHTCVVRSDGAVSCWGENSDGQLGTANNLSSSSPLPAQVDGKATSLALGGGHSCATIQGGTVQCWGRNNKGQLGNGVNTPSTVPVMVPGIGTATTVCAGAGHSCALMGDKTVRCWGDNFYGQLGDGTTVSSNSPVTAAVSDVVKIACGGEHTCATEQPFEVKCWGRNTVLGSGGGQLGNGTMMDSPQPVAVVGVGIAQSLTAGYSHSCALSNDTAYCWGNNIWGQLGTGATGASPTAQAVLLGNVTSVVASGGHTCGISLGFGSCWGDNASGQLGIGNQIDTSLPTLVHDLGAVSQLAAGAQHTCALLPGGQEAKCWGRNSFGQLGDGTDQVRTEPVNVIGL